MRKEAQSTEWLRVLPEKEKLRFTFVIGSIPIRFYHGDATDPPSKYLTISDAEKRQRQTLLDLGVPLDGTLRMAYETDSTRCVSRVALIQMNQDGDVIDMYDVPVAATSSQMNVVPLEPKGIDLPPLNVEPLEQDDQQQDGEQDERWERDVG
jgi:hypothetical protein